MTHAKIDAIIENRLDWLLDAIAMATQNRMFLRNDPQEDSVAIEAIYLNAKKAMESVVNQTKGLM